jgi:cephalosporin hydroxylase
VTRVRAVIGKLRREVSDAAWRARSMPPEYRRRWRMRIGDWLIHYYREVLLRDSHWMGVRCLKNPLDAWVYQQIVYETRPQVLVELGSAYGGSAIFFCHLFDILGEDSTVVCVDHSHAAFDAEHERITTVTGDTRDAEVIARVRALCEGKRAMVIHDASHDAEVVLEDLRNYSSLVAPGGYLIVEDGVGDLVSPAKGGRSSPGPLAAVADFLAENGDFYIDADRERHIATYTPRGFLRRRG